jgi:hypothetical protein
VAANILVTFTADSDSLNASVKQATKDIAVVGDKAAEAGAKASEAFKDAGKSAAAAFSSGQVKAAIDSQVKSIDSLRAGIDKLYKEELKLLQQGQKQSAAYKKNVEEAAKLRVELDKLSKGTNVYGNETGKVEKAAVSLKTQLKNLKAELSNLEAQGQENSKAFQDTAFQAARLEDQIGDTNERVRVLASDTFKFDAAIGAVKGLAASFSIAQGAAAAFGADSEDLNKVIARTQGAIALLSGLQEIANLVTGQGATKIAFQNIFMKDKVVTTYAAATATGVLATAEEGAAVATLTTVKSLNLLKLAIAGTGIGLLVIGLVALYKAWEESQQAALNAKKAYEEVGVSVRNLRQDNYELQKSLIDSADALAVAQGKEKQSAVDIRNERRDALEEGIKANGEYLLQIQQLKIREQELAKVVARSRNGTDFQDKKNRADLEANVKRRLELEKLVAEDIATRRLILSNKVQTIEQEELNSSKKNGDEKIGIVRTTLATIDTLETISFNGSVQRKEEELQLSNKIDTQVADNRKKQAEFGLALLDLQNIQGDTSLENTIARIKAEGEVRKASLNIATTDSIEFEKINAQTEANITKATKEENQKRTEEVLKYVEAIGSAFSAINDLSKQLSENRIADITATSEAELKAINDSTDTERQKDRERTALAKKTAAAISVEKTKQAKQDKALALFNIAVNTAQAIIGFLANPGGAKGVALSIIAGVTGAAQLAAVAAKPIPKFERGGVIGGQRHSQGGTMIEAERDEFIVNRGQSVKHRQELNAMNTSSAAFKKLIDERYVRPAVMSYMMQDKRRSDGVTVNAKLDSRSMESELRGLRKDIRKSGRKGINNSIDTRYSWQ